MQENQKNNFKDKINKITSANPVWFTIAAFTVIISAIVLIVDATARPKTQYTASSDLLKYSLPCNNKSDQVVTTRVTIVNEADVSAYDTLCITGSGRYRTYSTKEGFLFDTFRVFTPGDIVEVSGHWYPSGGTLVIGGELIKDIEVKEYPRYIPSTPTPSSIIVVTPTPNR